MLLLSIKLVGALLSLLFGAYGIGAETRKKGGSLNPKGRVAIVGLALGALITMSTTVLEEHERARAAQAEVQRYERLMRAQYSALTTRDARLDLKALIGIEGFRAVQPNYARRLKLALEDVRHCKDKGTEFEGFTAHKYQCGDYTIDDSTLSAKTLTFKNTSILYPNEKTEPYARALLNWIAVAVILGEEQTRGSWEQAKLQVQTGHYYRSILYSFDGDSLTLSLQNFPLDPSLLESANFSSLKDIVDQKTVTIIPNLVPLPCPVEPDPVPQGCEKFKLALQKSVSVSRLAIKFPHRRDLIFEGTGGPMKFVKHEKEKNQIYTRYVYTAPALVDDLPISDRSKR